jgi:hypothetical protein
MLGKLKIFIALKEGEEQELVESEEKVSQTTVVKAKWYWQNAKL